MMPACHRPSLILPLLVPLLLALALLPATAGATAFVPLADAALAERAPVIVEGRVLAVEPAPAERPAIDYLVQVERSIKGGLAGGVVVVRVPGGVRADGVGLLVHGAPRFAEGDEALLFLEPRRDGTFGLHQFLLGAFHLEHEGGVRVAWRDLAAAHRLELPGRAAPRDGPRDAGAFRVWLEARVAGRAPAAEYFLPSSATVDGTFWTDKFAIIVSTNDPLPFGCGANGGHRVRWFDFNIGTDVVGWRGHFSGQDGMPRGGFDEFETAIAAWNNDPNTPIRYAFTGLTAATAGFSSNDGINTVLFGDPNDEIGGSFDGAGLLALGGPWFDCATLGYGGENYHPILAADIITQDGLELFFASVPDPAAAAEQLFAHELGHTLGLAHSADPGALMFAEYHADLRGAALETDDLAGVFHLYAPLGPAPPSVPPPPPELTVPAAPADLTAVETSGGTVALAWSDNSDNESVFRIERRVNDTFALVTTIAADSTSFVDAHVEPETLYGYRLTAVNGGGDSPSTGVVEILTGPDRRPAAPTNLRAAPLSSTEIRLTWQDNADDEDGFVVEILIPPEWVEIPDQLPAGTRKLIVEGLLPASTLSFRVRAVNAFGSSAASNIATTTTFEDDDCVVTGDELCLLGGRFKISAAYRNQHDGGTEGTGTVVPSTDESGMFWFFSPANVELIVKALDGRGFNQHYWIFFGALSDLEYDITVTDTDTDTDRTYHNPPGEICGRADTAAFPDEPDVPYADAVWQPTLQASGAILDVADLRLVVIPDEPGGGPAPAPQALGTCQPGPQTLCLLDRRLSVDVRWHNQHDGVSEGDGYAIADSDNTGMFWFFDIENTELVVKALDGTGFNDQLWIFYGALTDLEYWITVTDTATGDSRVYYNAPGDVCGRADIEAFDAAPPDDPPPDDPPDGPPDDPDIP